MLDLETTKIKDFIKFDIGQLCMATGGHNRGRIGTIVHKEKHKSSFDIVLVRDSAGQEFATRCPSECSSSQLNAPSLSVSRSFQCTGPYSEEGFTHRRVVQA